MCEFFFSTYEHCTRIHVQKIAELALGVFPYFHCACFHHGAVRGALEHLHLDSCFLKCVDKFKSRQDRYLQKHYCTHPSNMTHPSRETVLVLWWFCALI